MDGSPGHLPCVSLYLDALSGKSPRNFRYEVPRGVVEIQFERTSLHRALVTQMNRLTQLDGPQKVSAGVIVPHAVSELKSARRMNPCAQANGTSSRVDVRVVDFSPAHIPVLVGFLDRLPAHDELDVPQANDGRVGGVSGRGGRQPAGDGGGHQRLTHARG